MSGYERKGENHMVNGFCLICTHLQAIVGLLRNVNRKIIGNGFETNFYLEMSKLTEMIVCHIHTHTYQHTLKHAQANSFGMLFTFSSPTRDTPYHFSRKLLSMNLPQYGIIILQCKLSLCDMTTHRGVI